MSQLLKFVIMFNGGKIHCHSLRITDQLGSGQFGTVSKGVWQLPGGHSKDVAVKTLQEGATEVDKIKFLQEAAINGQFMHPNVVKLMGVVTVGEPVSHRYAAACNAMY